MTSPSLARPSCRLSLIWSSSPAETRPLALEIILGCLPMTGSDPLPSWHFPLRNFCPVYHAPPLLLAQEKPSAPLLLRSRTTRRHVWILLTVPPTFFLIPRLERMKAGPPRRGAMQTIVMGWMSWFSSMDAFAPCTPLSTKLLAISGIARNLKKQP